MTHPFRNHKRAVRTWNRCLTAAVCIAALGAGAPVVADTFFDTPAAESDPLPISPAGANRRSTPAAPAGSAFTKSGTALAGVVVAIAVALTLARKFIPSLAPDAPNRVIQILGQTPLGQKGTVYVVRCGPRVLIVGATPGQLTTLAEIADPDEIDEFARLGAKATAARPTLLDRTNAATPAHELRGQVDGMLDRIDSWKTAS